MLGLNEIGTGDTEYFFNAYKEVIDRIMELQPDAIIYIQGIMHVTAEKANGDKNFNNEKINERNEAIAQLADQKKIFYIDMNEAVDDEDGNLDKSLSFDGVHLKASSYERWYEFLLHNAIVR
jgi:lysophospholipase L1-like esterase